MEDYYDIFPDEEEEERITAKALIRAMANGCPLDTAPDHIWREYCEAMRELARQVLRKQFTQG